MSDISEISKGLSNIGTLNFKQLSKAITQLGEAMAKALLPFTEAVGQVFDQVSPDAYHKVGMLHPREILHKYYRDEAEPAEVVQYILQQPKHTWMGVTIYPDEAWRYACKSDWMWWRE